MLWASLRFMLFAVLLGVLAVCRAKAPEPSPVVVAYPASHGVPSESKHEGGEPSVFQFPSAAATPVPTPSMGPAFSAAVHRPLYPTQAWGGEAPSAARYPAPSSAWDVGVADGRGAWWKGVGGGGHGAGGFGGAAAGDGYPLQVPASSTVGDGPGYGPPGAVEMLPYHRDQVGPLGLRTNGPLFSVLVFPKLAAVCFLQPMGDACVLVRMVDRQLARVHAVFHDAVPRASFGEPPLDPPMLGVYSLLSALERLGYSGPQLESHVRAISGVQDVGGLRRGALRHVALSHAVFLVFACQQVHSFVESRGVWPSQYRPRSVERAPPTRVVSLRHFLDFLGWWCGQVTPNGTHIVLNIVMDDTWRGKPGRDPWFDTVRTARVVCALGAGPKCVRLVMRCFCSACLRRVAGSFVLKKVLLCVLRMQLTPLVPP